MSVMLSDLTHEKRELSRLQLFHVYASFPPQHHLTQHHPSPKAHTNAPGAVPAPHPQPELLPIQATTPERNLAYNRYTLWSSRAETQTPRNYFEICIIFACFVRVGVAQEFRDVDEPIY